MGKFKKLSHVYYKCEYHIVFVPKYRYRILTGLVKTLVEHVISQRKEAEIQELSIQPDHIHVVCSVPYKVLVSAFMGTLKGKLAIKLFKSYPDLKKRPYWGNHFLAKGYFVSKVGLDSEMIKRYARYKEKEEHRNGQR